MSRMDFGLMCSFLLACYVYLERKDWEKLGEYFFKILWFYGVYCHFQQYFRWILWLSILLIEETTDLPLITDKLNHKMLYTSPWAGFELTTSVVIATDCINPTTIRLRPRQNYVKYNEIGNSYNNLILFIFLLSTYTDILYIQCSECKMGISTLYKTNTLSWIFKYLTETTVRGYTCHPIHWNNSPWVYMSPHSLK